MNQAQRIVLVIALGLATIVVAASADLVVTDRPSDGWFAYAPNTGVLYQEDTYLVASDDEAIVRRGLIWVTGLALWAAVSAGLLRSRTPHEERDG